MEFSINLSDYFDIELMAMYKTLFDAKVITPEDSHLGIVNQALDYLTSGSLDGSSSNEISFFIKRWAENIEDDDDHDKIREMLEKLRNKIEGRIKKDKEKREEKAQQYSHEKSLLESKKDDILALIRNGTIDSENNTDRSTKDNVRNLVDIHLHSYPASDYHYELICDDEIADFFFLRCQGEYSFKADVINDCIRRKDYFHAEALVERIIKTAHYPSFYDMRDSTGRWKGYSWEWETKNVFEHILSDVSHRIESEYEESPSEEEIQEVKKLTARILPILHSEAAKVVYAGYATLCSDNSQERQQYIDTLLNDVRCYSKKPRPRGYGGAPAVNRINEEIRDSFRTLERMWEPEVLAAELSILEMAGSELSPINFSRHMEWCVYTVSTRMIEYLMVNHPDIIEKWLRTKPKKRYVDEFVEKVGESENTVLINEALRMVEEIY